MKQAKRIFGGLLSLLLVATTALVVFRTQDIRDWWVLRNYVPSNRVQLIGTETTMTPFARNLFYVHDPQIEPAAKFNADCTIAESSIVLGCYDGTGIYVYDVLDKRLTGVHEVTAAHEMLHAAYDRLSSTERARVDKLTAQELTKITDQRVLEDIAAYRARDPSVVPNELHSILGTEVRVLDPELETYYKKYFTNRAAVVDLSEKYEQVFADDKAKVEAYDKELAVLKVRIDALEADLGNRATSLSIDKAELDRLAKNSQAAVYNARVPAYNSAVNSYNADLETYKGLVNQYNQKVSERNAITVEQNNLIKSLDSKAQEL